jgi:hypothetical protein
MRMLVGLLLAACCAGQTWEAGALAGGGFYNEVSVSNSFGRGAAGLASGAAFGGYLVQNLYKNLSGEIRYAFQRGNLQVTSGNVRASFRGATHAIHYDWLLHTSNRGASLRPFLAAGAGFKGFRGTGTESPYQPLGKLALLTQTSEWKPLISLGGGVAVRLASWAVLRAEFRDYLTPFPQKVIAPAGQADLNRWLHDFVPSLGVGLTF